MSVTERVSRDIVLVHGAWHGAWCWSDLVPLLEARGLRAHIFDLPDLGSGPTPAESVTLASYVERTVAEIDRIDESCWLLGHSMGGGVVTQATEDRAERLAGVIYLAAALPLDGEAIFRRNGRR